MPRASTKGSPSGIYRDDLIDGILTIVSECDGEADSTEVLRHFQARCPMRTRVRDARGILKELLADKSARAYLRRPKGAGIELTHAGELRERSYQRLAGTAPV